MTLLLLGCVPPSVIGLRTDGTMPVNSELSAGWGAFPTMAENAGNPLVDYSVAGLQARQRLSNRVAFSTSVGAVPSVLDQQVAGAGDAELQVQILAHQPVDLQLSVGLDAYVLGKPDDLLAGGFAAGVHTGLTLSRALPADLHPFVGTKLNPVFVDGQPYPWLQLGGGLSWRPALDGGTRGLLHVEATHYEGFGADLTAAKPADIRTWGFLVLAGASFGPSYGAGGR